MNPEELRIYYRAMALYEKRYPSWDPKEKDTQARFLAMNYTHKADKVLDALEDPKETP